MLRERMREEEMNSISIIRSLNLTDGDVLTLERAADRIEFEALPLFASAGTCSGGSTNCACNESKCSCDGTNCGVNWEF